MLLIKIWLIVVAGLSLTSSFIAGVLTRAGAKPASEDDRVLGSGLIGLCVLLWPLVLSLGLYWCLNVSLFMLGENAFEKQKLHKELKLKKALREEAKRKQDKLWKKPGD